MGEISEHNLNYDDYSIKRAESKKKTDKIVKGIFFAIAAICASVIIFIVVFILYKGILPFVKSYTSADGDATGTQDFLEFFTQTTWNGGEFSHGAGYLVLNTLYATALSLIISIPLSILTSVLITRIAPKTVSSVFQTGIELLASVPSVIYGLFGIGYICPMINSFANSIGFSTFGGRSLLSGVLVLALMSIPTMTLMSVTAIKSVNPAMIKASLALGASPTQTNFKIVLKDASSGIFAGIILGVGRALGEATAVQMVIGNAMSGPTGNPLDISATLTSTMLMGMAEAQVGSMGYDIRFSAGILLILLIIVIDLTLNHIKNTMYARRTGQKMKKSTIVSLFESLFVKAKNLKLASKGEDND